MGMIVQENMTLNARGTGQWHERIKVAGTLIRKAGRGNYGFKVND